MKEFNAFGNYLKSLEKFKFLTAEQEKELIKKAQNGNKKARDVLVQSNLRFVVDQAKKMIKAGCSANIEDLISAGNIGLIKAVSKFKLEKDVRFITCASFWIRAEMNIEIGLEHAIRLPHNCRIQLNKIYFLLENVPKGLNQLERYEYIAKEICSTKKTVQAIVESSKNIASLDSIEAEDDKINFYTFVGDSSNVDPIDEVIKKEFHFNFRKTMKNLSKDEREVIEKHYGLNGCSAMSLEEIANSWKKKITREAIRQKEHKAIKRFHEAENARFFEGFFNKAV